MHRYTETIYMIKSLIVQYMSLSNQSSIVASLVISAVATILGISILLSGQLRKYTSLLFVITALPLLIGIAGTVITIHDAESAVSMERDAGMKPSADRYYDLQYGYSKLFLYYFPLIAGIFSSIPPAIPFIILRRRQRRALKGTGSPGNTYG